MKNFIILTCVLVALISCNAQKKVTNDGWISLFDGKTLNGWQVGENASTFTVQDGAIARSANEARTTPG